MGHALRPGGRGKDWTLRLVLEGRAFRMLRRRGVPRWVVSEVFYAGGSRGPARVTRRGGWGRVSKGV